MTTLLESGARPYRTKKGVAISFALHGLLIAAAVAGTARAVLPPKEKVEEHPVLYVAPPPPAPLPPAPEPLPKVHIAPKRAPVAPPKLPVLKRVVLPQPRAAIPAPVVAAPTRIATSIPATNVALSPVAAVAAPVVSSAPASAPVENVTPEKSAGSGSGTGPSRSDGSAFTGEQVEREVQRQSGPSPRYPEGLKGAGVTGEVLMRFIVGTNGRVESGSFDVISSPNQGFTDAVRTALLATRFRAAEVGGRPVRQLVEQAFSFKIDR